MRTACRATLAAMFSLYTTLAVAAVTAPQPGPVVPGSPSWDGAANQSFGFSAPTVTQSGVTYAPNDPMAPPPATIAPLSDLPAWAAQPRDAKSGSDGVMASLGLRRFGSLPDYAGWALVIAGFMIIGGALRGLIVVNRRLNRLRSADEPEGD